MPTMLPTPSLPVKSSLLTVMKGQAIIWSLFGLTALLSYLSGIDTALAQALYHPHLGQTGDNWAWFLRQYASLPAMILSIGGLLAILWPGLWRKRPLLYKAALVMAFTTILGAGLFNQILVKNLADRPRPRESVLVQEAITPNTDSFRGNSMPSGHAAMGFVLVAPFFALRRQKPRLATGFLISGISLGFIVGLSRMVLGAHFLSDVLIAAALALSTAHLLGIFVHKYQRLPHTVLAVLVLLSGATVLLGNRFTGLTLTYEIAQPFHQIHLPCQVVTQPTDGLTKPTLWVKLNGYGAPLSNLKIIEDKNQNLTLRTSLGIYHHLTCTATLGLPTTE